MDIVVSYLGLAVGQTKPNMMKEYLDGCVVYLSSPSPFPNNILIWL